MYRVIILGSGNSIREEGLKTYPHLFDMLSAQLIFSCNYNYKYLKFKPFANFFIDPEFYEENKEDLDKYQLNVVSRYIAIRHPEINEKDNYLVIKENNKTISPQNFKDGIYVGRLTGIFAISFALTLDVKEIYLLGFDFGAVGDRTHWYDLKHRGVGFNEKNRYNTEIYNDSPLPHFTKIIEEAKIRKTKIYNVSLLSRLNFFEKIDYKTFIYKILHKEWYFASHRIMREEIKQKVRESYNES